MDADMWTLYRPAARTCGLLTQARLVRAVAVEEPGHESNDQVEGLWASSGQKLRLLPTRLIRLVVLHNHEDANGIKALALWPLDFFRLFLH